MRRKKNKATKKVHFESLPLIHPNAAGIDVGSKEHLVAVPLDRDPQPVRTFQAFTPDLHQLAAWLKRCGIETVALESTGIYWISLYEVLEQYGFEVRVVNARHVKNVPGRSKSDVLDCQWIRKLHSFGLLNGSFRPDQQVRKLRTYMRLKDNLVVEGTQAIHHMQKALFEMNVQLQQRHQRYYRRKRLAYYRGDPGWRTRSRAVGSLLQHSHQSFAPNGCQKLAR
jgi:transposase